MFRSMSAALLVVLAGCGGSSVDTGETGDAGDASLDVREDTRVDATIDGALDSPPSDTFIPADTSDTPPADAPAGVTLGLTASLFEDCMPIVADDPVSINGELVVTNGGSTAIGPLTATLGSVKTPAGATLATFRITSLSIPAIDPGKSGNAAFSKEKGSMFPATGCDTVKCGADVQIELTLNGPGLPPAGVRALSPTIKASCAF
jgi:hypothetical protein